MLHPNEVISNSPEIKVSELLHPQIAEYIATSGIPSSPVERYSIALAGIPEIEGIIQSLKKNDLPLMQAISDFSAIIAALCEFDIGILKDNRDENYDYPPIEVPRKLSFLNKVSEIISTRPTDPKWDAQILLFDINGVKKINDIYGSKAGDQLIQKVAFLLKQACAGATALFKKELGIDYTPLMGRLGGDEFGIFFSGTKEEIAKQKEIFMSIVTSFHLPISAPQIKELFVTQPESKEFTLTKEALTSGQIPDGGESSLNLSGNSSKDTSEILMDIQDKVNKIEQTLAQTNTKLAEISKKLDGAFMEEMFKLAKSSPIFGYFIIQSVALDRRISQANGEKISEYNFPLTKAIIKTLYKNLYDPSINGFVYDNNLLQFLMKQMKNTIFIRLNPDLKVLNDHISHGVGDQILETMRKTFLNRSKIGVGLSNSKLLSAVSIGKDGPEIIITINTKQLSKAESELLVVDLKKAIAMTRFVEYGPIQVPIGIDMVNSTELEGVNEPIGESKVRANEERTMNKLMTILSLSDVEFQELLTLLKVKMDIKKKSGVSDQVDLIWKGFNNNRRKAQLIAIYQLNEQLLMKREIKGKKFIENSDTFIRISELQEELFVALQQELETSF
jgi:GGDEF domain-containing protein